ncbi:hypothetical protein PHLCEN_2v4584 [Hermanssonia centrifuga]|uniref:Bromodomain and PHD finger-containing protein n=1 Tax=Hermanssonia centrifuga TaxID=98765 RepID=A0A2R6PN42_9APHY|nr:hypothetical protein PHLCEN_2v4584 [Hermanssonia centrifuga]
MARGGTSPTPTLLPKVSFTRVQDELSTQPSGVHDQSSRSYGYNDGSDFRRPEHYIRYIEPLESELAIQVEYDMDEQDQEWMDSVNTERKANSLDKVSYEAFEIIMDRLEKEWFDLTKNIPKPDMVMPSEDSTCAICDDSEGENTNAIVFCDGCNLAVHQGGAFKQTVQGEWVHLLCAIWVPETRVANDVFMEPVTGVDKISKQRWKEQAEARAAALAAEQSDATASVSSPKSSKTARAYAKTYKPGPPLVPRIIVNRILQYLQRVAIRQKPEFVIMVCKYWSLKREARRGAPLLKRLHLEPWTASGGRNQSDEDKATKLEYMKRLREDLDKVRILADICRRREVRKLDQQQIIQNVFSRALFSNEPTLRMTFEKIRGHDRHDYFKNPVSKVDVPDYYDIIRRPICWNVIDQKLDGHRYWDLQDFKDDIHLVLDNAMLYNHPGTPFYKTALRIKTAAGPLLSDLDRLKYRHPEISVFMDHEEESKSVDPNLPSSRGPLGDLEPPLELLKLLVQKEAIQDDIDLIIDVQPIVSLFSYEFGKFKPPPPPPPPPKPKRDRKAERERLRLARAAALDVSAVRAPRTRHALAVVAAFEAEAHDTHDTEQVTEDHTGDSTEAPTETKPKGKRWRRAPFTLPGQSEVPPVVENVDNQQSFKMFDGGWILPDAQRRGGRAPLGRQLLLEPKRKKPRTGMPILSSLQDIIYQWIIVSEREKSHLSVGTTTAVENATPRGHSEPREERSEAGPSIQALVDEVPQESREDSVVPVILTTQAMEIDEPPPDGPEQLEEVPLVTGEPTAPTVEQDQGTVPTPTPEPEPQGKRVRKVIIIEKLDTPATRRAENQRRREEKRRREAEAATALTELSQSMAHGPIPGPSRHGNAATQTVPGADVDMDSQSELTSLTDEDIPGDDSQTTEQGNHKTRALVSMQTSPDGLQGEFRDGLVSGFNSDEQDFKIDDGPLTPLEGTPQAAPAKRSKGRGSGYRSRRKSRAKVLDSEQDIGLLNVEDGKFLEGGTLVWAKAETYPWWPAVVYEPDDPEVAPNALLEKQPSEIKSQQLHLVQFFDQRSLWGWFEPSKLRMLGENDELDADMVAANSKRQKWKTPRARDACRKAYRRATAEMETAGREEQTEEDRNPPENPEVTEQKRDVDMG